MTPCIVYRYLQNNAIGSLEGLERLPELEVLNVSNNRLTALDPLSQCTKLTMFLGASNDLSAMKGINAVTQCKLLATVDLQDNVLSDAQVRPLLSHLTPVIWQWRHACLPSRCLGHAML